MANFILSKGVKLYEKGTRNEFSASDKSIMIEFGNELLTYANKQENYDVREFKDYIIVISQKTLETA